MTGFPLTRISFPTGCQHWWNCVIFRTGILVVPVSTLMHRLLPADYLLARSLYLRTGQTLETDVFRQELDNNGYRNVSQVMEHGDVATRGSILDIYPMGSAVPFRLDLFDDEIDSIRIFDIETQRSWKKPVKSGYCQRGKCP